MKAEPKNLVSDTYISFIVGDNAYRPEISEKNTHSNKLPALSNSVLFPISPSYFNPKLN